MSARDSGYGDPWSRNRNRHRSMAQPSSTNVPFAPDQDKESQPLQPDQYQFPSNSYRNPCATGTSVSARDSQPDYQITQTPLDEVNDPDFDSISLPPTDTLAGLGLLQATFLDMNPLNLDSTYNPMTPNTSRYPDLPLSDPDFASLFSNETPWSGFRTMPQDDNMLPNQPQSYDRSTGKRRRIMTDSGIGTTQQSSPTSAFMPPHHRTPSRSQQDNDYPYHPTSAPAQQDDTDSPYHQEQRPGANSFAAHRHTSPSSSQRSPRSAPKAQRKSSEKHLCDRCDSKGFGTINDLTRHRKGVHGLFEPGDKIWPRRDNFSSHLKRMHFDNNDTRTRENIDRFEEIYDSEKHGSLDFIRIGKGGGGHRSKSTQDFAPPIHPTKHTSMSNASVAQQTSMGGMTGQGRGIFNQYGGRMVSNVSESLASSTMNHGNQTTNVLSSMGGRATLAGSSQALQPPQYGGMNRNMGRPGDARTAPPNPDSRLRQKREMHEQDQSVQQAPGNGPSMEDLSSIGYSGTIDPSMLYNTRSHDRTIDLNATSDESRPDLDPEKEVEEMLKKLSAEQRSVLRRLNPEARARFFNTVEQVDESDQDQDASERSVTKPSTKKKTDGEKTLKCNHLVEKKGDKEKNLVHCSARFNSQSELRKHCKRHDKRFGCTFDNCYSKFGTKWEWKRHEQSQHIQNEAWRCRQVDGEDSCQELFNDQKKFEDHLTQKHLFKSDTKEMTNEIDECHLLKKWLGSYWCGYCKRVVQSQMKFGRNMDDERVEHIGAHVVKGSKSTDWVELAAGGKTKGQVNEIKDHGSASVSHSDEVQSVKQLSHHEMEGEEADGNDGGDFGESEDTDSDDSNSRAALQQPRTRPPTLGVITTQNDPFPPSSQGSHTGHSSSTPTIHGYTPDGQRIADHMLDAETTRPMRRQRAYSDNNTAGYRNQHQNLQAQAQARSQPHQQLHSQPQPQPQQTHALLRYCCRCQRTPWTPYQNKCEYLDCQHQCAGEYCSFSTQGGYGLGGFPSDDGSGFAFYGTGV